jgi:hypothetical protein
MGSTITVSAVTPQTVGAASEVFSQWSDGGAQTHEVTVGTATTLTATYNAM